MSKALHETLASLIDNDIFSQIRQLRESPDTKIAEVASRISPTRSTSLKLRANNDEYNKHEPDLSYRYRRSKFPGLVIEISWSQRPLDLPRLARSYIRGSNGLIRTVIGVDVEYPNADSATLSVWRAEFGRSNGDRTLNATEIVVKKVNYHNIKRQNSFMSLMNKIGVRR